MLFVRKREAETFARREAIGWIYRLAEPDAIPDDRARFADWLRSSPEHVHQFLLATAFLESVAQWRGFPPLGAIVAGVEASNGAHVPSAPPLEPPRRVRTYLAAGVCLVVLLAATFIVLERSTRTPDYVTAVGESKAIDLADGSHVRLNTNSRLRVNFSSGLREVRLVQGEARFDVHHDARRPFDVVAQCGTMRALGTAFVVYARTDGTCDLTVEHGRVRASPRASDAPANGGRAERTQGAFPVTQRVVTDGQVASIAGNVTVTRLAPAQLRMRLAWLRGVLIFENTRLADAVEQFNRYNTTQLIVGDPSLADLTIGGGFMATHAEQFASALRDMRIRAETSAGPRGTTVTLTRDDVDLQNE